MFIVMYRISVASYSYKDRGLSLREKWTAKSRRPKPMYVWFIHLSNCNYYSFLEPQEIQHTSLANAGSALLYAWAVTIQSQWSYMCDRFSANHTSLRQSVSRGCYELDGPFCTFKHFRDFPGACFPRFPFSYAVLLLATRVFPCFTSISISWTSFRANFFPRFPSVHTISGCTTFPALPGVFIL